MSFDEVVVLRVSRRYGSNIGCETKIFTILLFWTVNRKRKKYRQFSDAECQMSAYLEFKVDGVSNKPETFTPRISDTFCFNFADRICFPSTYSFNFSLLFLRKLKRRPSKRRTLFLREGFFHCWILFPECEYVHL